MESTIGNFDRKPVDVKISSFLQDRGWQSSHDRHTQANQWQGYLNYLCLRACLPWFADRYGGRSWTRETASYWEFVDGSIVTLGRYRLCLLPHTSCDRSEIRVPREWIEIPNWVADYYWAVQMDLDGSLATIWGGASHATIQKSASYDSLDRTYSLDADDGIDGLSVAQLLSSSSTRGRVNPLPTLTTDRIDRYLTEWSRPQLAIPRLDIGEAEFIELLALLANDGLRIKLWQRRLAALTP